MSTLRAMVCLRRSLHRCEEELVGGRASRKEEWVVIGRVGGMMLLFALRRYGENSVVENGSYKWRAGEVPCVDLNWV